MGIKDLLTDTFEKTIARVAEDVWRERFRMDFTSEGFRSLVGPIYRETVEEIVRDILSHNSNLRSRIRDAMIARFEEAFPEAAENKARKEHNG